MTFKDQVQQDMESVFFNVSEHATTATYKGATIPVIEDGGFIQNTGVPGVTIPALTIHIRASDVSNPKQGDKVVIGGKTYYVGPAPSFDGGVWTLTLDQETKNMTIGV